MRILMGVTVPFPDGGANTRRIRTIGRELARQGCSVAVVCPLRRQVGRDKESIEGMDVEWCFVPTENMGIFTRNHHVRLWVQLVSRTRWMFRICRILATHGCDWLYIYQPGPDSLVAGLFARLFHVRVCAEYTDVIDETYYTGSWARPVILALRLSDLVSCHLANVVITISRQLEERYGQMVRHACVLRIPTVVDVDRFSSGCGSSFRACHGYGTDQRLIGYAGSFSHANGVMSLLAAFEETVKSIPDALLLIAGGNIGTDRDPVEQRIEDRGLQGRAVCLGILQEEQIIDFLAAVDIVVLPKLDDPANWAGMSTKLGEYLAAGRALVATRVGDVGATLQDGVDALLVDAGDAEEMASAIARLLEDDALRRRMGGQARQLAEQQFSARTWVSRLVVQLEMAGQGTGEGQK